MRLLTIHHYPRPSGALAEAQTLHESFKRVGIDQLVLVPSGTNIAGMNPDFVLERRLGRLRRPQLARREQVPSSWATIQTIRNAIRELAPDVVRVSGPHNPHGAIAARLEGIPVTWALTSALDAGLRTIGAPLVRSLADSVLFNGASLRSLSGYRHIAGGAVPAFDYVTPVNLERLTDALARPSPSPFARPVIGTIADGNPQKGHEHLIQGFATMSRSIDCDLAIIGEFRDDSYATRIQRLVQTLGIGDRVHFMGYRSDALSVARHFSVFVVASVSEGTTATVSEARGLGLPLVTTTAGAIRDAVDALGKGNVWMVPAGDAEALSIAMSQALHHAENHGTAPLALAGTAVDPNIVAIQHQTAMQAAIDGMP